MDGSAATMAAITAIVPGAREDSALFTEALFGYVNADFHREWHDAWNAPGAHVVQWAPIEHGKTQQATGWALWLLGRNPATERILWIGAAQTPASKSVGIVKRAIEEPSAFLRAVFPGLRPGDPWTDTSFRVDGAKSTEKDHSVEAIGAGSAILGGRFTTIILDDICTYQTTYTSARRREITRWVQSTVLGRLLPGGRIVVLGNAWYPDDVMHALADRGFQRLKHVAYREAPDGRILPGSVLWPEQFPVDRLGEYSYSFQADGAPSKRRELGSTESARQLKCEPYTSGQGRFRMEWFERAMADGSQLTLLHAPGIYDGAHGPAFGGLDIGVNEKEGSDPSALWVFAQQADGRRRLLDAEEHRFDPPALIDAFADWHRRFNACWKVENNAAQEFFRAWAKTEAVPSMPHTTGKNKADPALGVPSLAVELEQGMWILPSGDERSVQIATMWRTQCLEWSPGQHTGDLLMASWFGREAARAGSFTPASSSSEEADSRLRAGYGRLAGQRAGLMGGRLR